MVEGVHGGVLVRCCCMHACHILTTSPNEWRGTTDDYTHLLPSNFVLLLTSSPASSFLNNIYRPTNCDQSKLSM